MDNPICPNVQKLLDEITPEQWKDAEDWHRELVRGFVEDWQSFYSLKAEVIRDGKCRAVIITLPDRG